MPRIKQNTFGKFSAKSGFSLLEVLVSLIVLATVILGMVQINLKSLLFLKTSDYKERAHEIAFNLADSVRYRGSEFKNIQPSYYKNIKLIEDCTKSGCSAKNLVKYDIFVSSEQVKQLPSGQFVICLDSTPEDGKDVGTPKCDEKDSSYAIKIWWKMDDGDAELSRIVVNVDSL